jgi:chromate transporter
VIALKRIVKMEVSTVTTQSVSTQVHFRAAFWYWLKLGFISFGGPAGQIAIMHRDLVEERRWISEERFVHALNYCMLLPGPEAQQLAVYIGWLLHRAPGGIVAGAFFILPSIFILLGLSYIYAVYGNLPIIVGVLNGFKPVVVAIVVEAIVKIGKRALKRKLHFVIAVLAFVAIYFLHVPFPLIVLVAGLVGFVAAKFAPEPIPPTSEPLAAHTLPSHKRTVRVLLLGVLLWALPFGAIVLWRGSDSLYAQLYRFFTQAALVTFGGAYSVLAYVSQAAVTNYQWLTAPQAVDGLALAETTPGPLIMVLQFVGFMAGWNQPQGLTPNTSAILSALITTYTTFLPSFFFIFLGAPYIEALRGNQHLTAALSGITAAVVGVVLNLGFVFGGAVILPNGVSEAVNWFAALLSVVAFVALFRWHINVLWIVLAGGVIGLARMLLGLT